MVKAACPRTLARHGQGGGDISETIAACPARGPALRARRRDLRALEEADAVTVEDVATSWLAHLKVGPSDIGHRDASLRSTLNMYILPTHGDVPIAGLAPELVETLLEDIPNEIPRCNAARTLQTLLNFAVETEAGGITSSPFKASIPRPRPRRCASTGRRAPRRMRSRRSPRRCRWPSRSRRRNRKVIGGSRLRRSCSWSSPTNSRSMCKAGETLHCSPVKVWSGERLKARWIGNGGLLGTQ